MLPENTDYRGLLTQTDRDREQEVVRLRKENEKLRAVYNAVRLYLKLPVGEYNGIRKVHQCMGSMHLHDLKK